MQKCFFTIFLFCFVASNQVYAQIIPPGQALTGYGSSENYMSDTYSSHESGVLEDGTQLFYYIPDILKNGDSAPAVIFLHGMFITTPPFQEGNGYSEHLTHLLRQGYIVIYPQFNTDYDVDQNLMLDRCVTSTNTALAAIGSLVETDNLVLYGHSVGGILSLCWKGAGGVPVKALVTAQGNMNLCVAGLPDWVCPLITKLDYQTLAPSMTCPAILLWGDADSILAPWSHQLDAFNSLTNVSSKIIYTAQSDDYGDPDLTAGHGAPGSPVDTLDYRYYWAALDAALDDQVVVDFDMGLWSDRTPVKPVLEYFSEGSVQIDTCKVKAGKNGKGDSIQFSGLLDATADDFISPMGGNVVVTISALDIPDTDLTTFTFPIDEDSFNKGKYKSPKFKPIDKSNSIASLQIDTNKGTIKFSGKNVDLSGLSCPITITIQIGEYVAVTVLNELIVNGPKKPCPPELMAGYIAAGILDNQIIKLAQIMTTHIEDTGIAVRATKVNALEFGGSYAGINAAENWVQPYFTFIPEDMSAYANAPSEINGILMTKMKSKDGIEAKFGSMLEGTQGTCADVQEEIYASTFSLLGPKEREKYSAEGKSLSFIQDDRPGNTPNSNPVLQSSGWLPIDPATKITSDGDNYFYEPLGLYISFYDPLAGDDERYKGVRYCKLLSHQAILSWFLSKSFEEDPVLITESAIECTDPRLRTEPTTNGSCLFLFGQVNNYYCSDYIGYDFTPESAEEKCSGRGESAVYSPLTCSERDESGEIEATIPEYVGHGALCVVHCLEGNEFIWNYYGEVDLSDPDHPSDVCGGFPIFYP